MCDYLLDEISKELGNMEAMEINQISGEIVDAAMTVHTRLGPGLLELPYKKCLEHELKARGLSVRSEVYLPVLYESTLIDVGYRLDLLVNSQVIVEVKAVQTVIPVHRAQLLTYLRLTKKHVGLLINFQVIHLKDGIERFVF
jgi:GxxExxY protein